MEAEVWKSSSQQSLLVSPGIGGRERFLVGFPLVFGRRYGEHFVSTGGP